MSTSAGRRNASSSRAQRATPTKPSARAARQTAVAERDRREARVARARANRTLDALTRLEAARERNPNAYRGTTKGVFNPRLERALAAQARTIEGMDHERLSVHDSRTGQMIFTKDGREYRTSGKGTFVTGDRGYVEGIRLNQNQVKQMAGHVEMHNHPYVDGHETNFSEEDIHGTIGAKSSGTRVVTPQGSVTMRPPSNGRWPSYGRAVGPAFKRHYDAISKALLDRVRKGTEPGSYLDIMGGDIAHLAWRQAARDTGIRYSRRIR